MLKENQVFKEERQSFMDDGASTSTTQPTQKNNCEIVLATTQDMDPDILKSFL